MDRPAAWRAIAIDLEAERPFRVGGATIDPLSRDATYPGGLERLQPQTIKVLIALAHHKGDVITRSELIDSCWGGRIVGEDVINRSISVIRDFAERAGGFSIETVPKAGYRLVEDGQQTLRRRMLFWVLPVVLLAGSLTTLWLLPAFQRNEVDPPLVALRTLTSSADPASRDLAAATGDTLAHMMVAGSFHGKLAWPATAKDEEKADLILSGDVRRTGGTYAAMVQLRDRRSGTLLFSERFEAPIKDPSRLPEQVGAQMSSNLTGALALMVLDRRQSGNPDLTADKLKTITIIVSNQDPLASYQISRRVAQTHPDSVLAQLGLAYDTAFALGSLPREERPEAVRRARIAAQKAFRMDPDFGDTYVPWCLLRPASIHSRECEDRMRAGLEADPDAPFVPAFLSSLLYAVGRFEEAAQFARTSLAADPFHPHKLRRVVRTLIVLGKKEEAEQLFDRAVRWWPEHSGLYWDRLNAYALTGDLEGAERAIAQMPPSMLVRQRLQISSMLSAYRAGQRGRVHNLCLRPNADFLLTSFCLTTLNQLGDRSAALQVAEQLFPRTVGASDKETEAIWINDPDDSWPEPIMSAPATAWLRADPRFLEFARRTGISQYWRRDRLPDFCRESPEPVCAALRKLSR